MGALIYLGAGFALGWFLHLSKSNGTEALESAKSKAAQLSTKVAGLETETCQLKELAASHERNLAEEKERTQASATQHEQQINALREEVEREKVKTQQSAIQQREAQERLRENNLQLARETTRLEAEHKTRESEIRAALLQTYKELEKQRVQELEKQRVDLSEMHERQNTEKYNQIYTRLSKAHEDELGMLRGQMAEISTVHADKLREMEESANQQSNELLSYKEQIKEAEEQMKKITTELLDQDVDEKHLHKLRDQVVNDCHAQQRELRQKEGDYIRFSKDNPDLWEGNEGDFKTLQKRILRQQELIKALNLNNIGVITSKPKKCDWKYGAKIKVKDDNGQFYYGRITKVVDKKKKRYQVEYYLPKKLVVSKDTDSLYPRENSI